MACSLVIMPSSVKRLTSTVKCLNNEISQTFSMDFAERMKSARKRAGYETPASAAKAIGCARTMVVAWEDGSIPSLENSKFLLRAATVYAVAPDFLMMRSTDDRYPWQLNDTPVNHPVSYSEIPDGYLRIDRIDAEAAMGFGIENGDFPEIIDSMVIAKEEVRRQVGFIPQPDRLKLMTGRGDSLKGVIEPGEVVWVDTLVNTFDGDGVYLINTGNGQQFKILQDRELLYVCSTNPAYKDFPAPADMIIGGKVMVNIKISRMG